MQLTQWIAEIKSSWFIIIFIGALVIQWTNIDNRIATVEKQLDEQYPMYLEIQRDIVEIKTTLEFIRFNLTAEQGK